MQRHWSNWHQERGREEFDPYLKSINSLLFRAVLATRAFVGDQVEPYTVNELVAPGKKEQNTA